MENQTDAILGSEEDKKPVVEADKAELEEVVEHALSNLNLTVVM